MYRINFLLFTLCLSVLYGDGLYVKPTHEVTLNIAHKGTLEVDTKLLDSYGKLPDDIRSFYLEARAILAQNPKARLNDLEIVNIAKNKGLDLISGPMLGDIQEDVVSLWFRPVEQGRFNVNLIDSQGETKSYSVESQVTGEPVRVRLNDLEANTEYSYQILNKSEKVLAKGEIRTPHLKNAQETYRITFGADFHKIGLHNPNLFKEILKRKPLAMFLYGDSATDGRKNNINMHEADYLLRDVSEPWRDFTAQVPVFASWDDWDYYANDASGSPNHINVGALRKVWQRNWVNPTLDAKREGIYFSTRIGPMEYFMLDTRSCREIERKGKLGCYLGQEQHEWLKEALLKSTAPFKVISSGTMWSDYVSRAKDSWGTWDKKGREEIFNVIEENDIGGVLLLSGDRHGARAFRIPRNNSSGFYEFGIGNLGGVPGPVGVVKNCPDQLFGYNGPTQRSFGEFTFDMTKSEPEVTFRLINDYGKVMEKLSFKLSEL